MNEKLSKLPNSHSLETLCKIDLFLTFDATSIYPFAMLDPEPSYPKTSTSYAFEPRVESSQSKQPNDETISLIKVKYSNYEAFVLET